MSETNRQSMPDRASPGHTRFALPVEEPVQVYEKWATGTTTLVEGPGQVPEHRAELTGTNSRSKWSRADNKDLMVCYYNSEPTRRGYMKRMTALWQTKRPDSKLTEKQLVAQRSNIIKKKLLSELELEEVERQCKTASTQERNPQTRNILEIRADETMPVLTNETLDEPTCETTIDLKKKLVDRMKQIKGGERQNLPRLKTVKCRELEVIGKINEALRFIPTNNITETNLLTYAAAAETLDQLGIKVRKSAPRMPPWKHRLETKIKDTRKEISQITEVVRGKSIKDKERLERKYKGQKMSEVLEMQKQKLTALAARLERYCKEDKFRKINSDFNTDPAKVYSELRGEQNTEQPEPPKEETERFWKNIWENEKRHNEEASWLKELEEENKDKTEQTTPTVTEKDVKDRVSKMKNWRAPGLDKVHGFWLKKFSALHRRLADHINQMLQSGNHPDWLTQGRTAILIKDRSQGNIPKNYRPITCLSTTWKLLSGILAQKIQVHMKQFMHVTQKGIGNGFRGTKHQLLIDKAVIKDSKKRQANLGMAWIDYKKAYDSVPHSWILKCLQLYKVNRKIIQFIEQSMSQWKTTLTVNNKVITDVAIKCGIYQGDALSPLLFCISLNPLSDIINKSEYGYKFKSGTKINHLMYMDDIKLYAKSERDIDSLIHLTRIFSNDIGMSFGLEKCGRLIVQRGKVSRTEGIVLPEGHIADVEEKYKYLGILQSYGNHEVEVRQKATTEYKKRIRQVLKSQLTAKNKVTAINTYAVPVIRYTAGIIEWPKEEIKKLDIQTRKLFTLHGAFHPKSSTDRLYQPRKEGGRGLCGIERAIHEEQDSLHKYIKDKAKEDQCLKEYEKQRKVSNEESSERDKWQDKPLHGRFHQSISGVADLSKSYQWLEKTDIRDNTEALIMAAQEQALKTRAIEAKIYHTRQDSKCRLCGVEDETIQHIVSGCKMLAGTAYTERHNQVALLVYRSICKVYELETPKNWWEFPDKVTENDRAKILWDFHIQTDKQVIANQPDIVLVDKGEKNAIIIDIAVPNDFNVKEKEHEKISKYQPLAEELRRIWKVKTKVVPVVVGALGALTSTHEQWLSEIPGKQDSTTIQKSALLGTAKILRRTLKLPGLW